MWAELLWKNKVSMKKVSFNKFNRLLTYYIIKVEVWISAHAEILWPSMCMSNFKAIGQAVWAVFRRQENVSGRGGGGGGGRGGGGGVTTLAKP